MSTPLGQLVLDGKYNLSCDYAKAVGENARMAKKPSEYDEKIAFITRTRSARLAKYPTQKEMLIILELDQGKYKQYESRTPLPHRYIPKFCAATGVRLEWLLANQGSGPALVELPKRKKRWQMRRRVVG
jgi:hypothetical protein